MQNLSPEQQEQIREAREQALVNTKAAFEGLDTDKNGYVDKQELEQLMASQGGPGVDQSKIDDFFKNFDANGDGKVTLAEWLDFFGNMFDTVMIAEMNNAQ